MKKSVIYCCLALVLIILSGCMARLHEVKRTESVLGTVVTITVHDEQAERAEQAIDDAFWEIMRINDLLSNFEENSEVFILNQKKEITEPSAELKENIDKARHYSELSNGSFDITVQPLLDLYKESFQVSKRPPTEEEIKNELKKVDYTKIAVSESKISMGKEQSITLGGIAKGYAVEKAMDVLKEHGIKHALVNAGGDMRALGKKYGSFAWSAALANPRDRDDYITIIKLSDEAVVTSGDYERYFDEDKEFHHIVDPKTGYSATELISVTIVADNAFDADAISTSVFVLGKEKGMEMIESMENVEGLLITREREIVKSSGFD